MKSGKQRRTQIKAHRALRKATRLEPRERPAQPPKPYGTVPVNEHLLAPYNSYGAPEYVCRGFYVDMPFTCAGCGRKEIWTATQQKWWYEVAKGYVYSTAKFCRPCRRKEQARQEEAKRVHLAGLARKQQSKLKT